MHFVAHDVLERDGDWEDATAARRDDVIKRPAVVAGPSAGYEPRPLTATLLDGSNLTLNVLRPARSGPSVIVIHEATGLTESTFRIAERLTRAGLTPVLPILAGEPLPRLLERAGIFKTICTARLFGAWADDAEAPIVRWLNALAEHEYELSDRRPIGVVGMCFSGGYALAMALRPVIGAAVASQPAFPAAIPGRRRRLGVRSDDLSRLALQTKQGACVRALRFRLDQVSPGTRQRALRDLLPQADTVEVPNWNPLNHAVLSHGISAPNASRLWQEVEATVEFLSQRLLAHDGERGATTAYGTLEERPR